MNKTIAVNNTDSDTFLDEAKKYHASGSHDKAVEFYIKAAIDCPNDNYAAISRMARCLSFQKKFKPALDAHLFLAVKYPQYHQGDSFYILKNGLRTHIKKKKNYNLCRYAIDILEKIAQLLHNKTKVYDTLSDLYWCIEEKEKAIKTKSLASCELALKSKRQAKDLRYSEAVTSDRLPDFMIIGPQKTGTTALYSYLVEHPNIYTSIQKEIFYFNTDLYHNGIDWYKSHFPTFISNQEYLTGEATAKYFNSPIAAERIAKDLPSLKIIFILRDPAARAISDYYMKVRNGIEKRSLAEAISSEIELLEDCSDTDLSTISREKIPNNKRYVLSGVYYFFIKAYISRLSPEQFLILESSNLKNNHDTVLKEIHAFLNVENYISSRYQKPVNVGKYPKKDLIYQETYKHLTNFYRPYNKMLEEFTEINFPWI